MEESAHREVLRGPAEHLFTMLQDEAPGAQEAIVRVRPRRVLPSRGDTPLGEEPNHPFPETRVRSDEIPTHARVASGKHDRPRKVPRSVEEARAPGGPADRRDTFLDRPSEERSLGADPHSVGDRPVAEDRHADGGNGPSEDRLVGADVVGAAHTDIDPSGEARLAMRFPYPPSRRGNRRSSDTTGASKG